MIKTVKGKVITGVTAFALISGGAVMASTDAGSNLKAWYDAQFGKSTAKVAKDSTDYANGKAGSLYKEYDNLKKEGSGYISTAGSLKTAEGTTNINSAKDQHINSVQSKETEIQNYMTSQFDGLFAAAQKIIDETAKEGSKWANQDLTAQYGKDGLKAASQVETDLGAVKGAAVKELETAINQAKTEIQASLDSNTTATTEQIKKAIDAKIKVMRGEITTLRDNLVAAQKQIIANKAIALENQAKAEMDSVVADINR
ncbi:hypothetical protein [Gracilibacillus sp. Marseille-QA3620]